MTYTLISTQTIGAGGAASIDFTSIPGTYTDLLVVYSGREITSTSYSLLLTFNGVSTNLSAKTLDGNGSTANSYTYASTIPNTDNGADTTANTFSNLSFYIPNYAGSTNKTVSFDGVSETNGTTVYSRIGAGLWASTAAITRITLTPPAYTLAQYSTATLYGIN
jgi:hypothetical protein